MNITKHDFKEVLSNVDFFVSNVGLTTLKKVKMNKYLDFRVSGKDNPNPYYERVLIEQRLSNIQTGFDYVKQLTGKYKREGIVPVENEDKKDIWFNIVSKSLVVDKKTGSKFYFRYQDHESSYIDVTYTFNGEPIEYNLVRPYVKESKTDYSKYQNGLDNPTQAKLLNIKYIKRMAISKEVYEVI